MYILCKNLLCFTGHRSMVCGMVLCSATSKQEGFGVRLLGHCWHWDHVLPGPVGVQVSRSCLCGVCLFCLCSRVMMSGEVGPKCRGVRRHGVNKGFNAWNEENRQDTHGTGVTTRQRLDTKQEPNYTEPNKTQVDTMKLTRTEQDAGENNETGKH